MSEDYLGRIGAVEEYPRRSNSPVDNNTVAIMHFLWDIRRQNERVIELLETIALHIPVQSGGIVKEVRNE